MCAIPYPGIMTEGRPINKERRCVKVAKFGSGGTCRLGLPRQNAILARAIALAIMT